MMKKKNVIVVTFVWRDMQSMEKMAFECGATRLGRYPFAVCHPQSYSIESIKQKHPSIIDIPLDDSHFESRKRYNEMMLSPDFYQLFEAYDFMLVYQLNAFVFRDELEEWVACDYDYIGAPWLPNDSWFQHTIGEMVIRFRKLWSGIKLKEGHVRHADRYFEVGNGGFSLRKISTMIRILSENRCLIDALPEGSLLRNEDIALSLVLGKKCHLKKPDWRTAVRFSFENNPTRCFRITHERLPFGCHAWDTNTWEEFWRGIVWFDDSVPNN